MKSKEKIINTLILKNGFEIDMDEGWQKLTSSQFGGSPGRAFSELIQNAIDSYPSGTPWKEKKGAITTSHNSISITDWGEGLNTKRLTLLATAGGTDKYDDPEKIGRFGLGFISIFNPQLGTTRVEVITNCEGYTVELVFTVTDPKKKPVITAQVLDSKIQFSTKITITFSNSYSVTECIKYAQKCLIFYPCPVTINNELFPSEWQKNNGDPNISFSDSNCDGIIRKSNGWKNINILCKYELVMHSTLSHFITGGYNMKYNLEDFAQNNTPYIPYVDIIFNINNLRLVISRDSYYLDWNYTDAKLLLNKKLRYFLYLDLKETKQNQVTIANQYIFRNEIHHYLKNPGNSNYKKEENKLIKLLSEMPVYKINGRSGFYSIGQLNMMLSTGNPFFYSPERTNLRWLGGSFKHNYIVIPENCNLESGAPLFFDRLFGDIFKDVVNLDNITTNIPKIQELVKRGIVDKSALSPECNFIGIKNLTKKQIEIIDDLTKILSNDDIQAIICNNLQIQVNSIKPVFFSLNNEGFQLSTGIFDANGKPVSNEYASNFLKNQKENNRFFFKSKKLDLFLGLNSDHPFINYLVDSNSAHKEYYALTYLAHELALCQKMLVPYSPFYHLVKEKLAQDMRKALLKHLLIQSKN